MAEHHMLRDPWELTLAILLAVVWLNGMVFGYAWGWKFGDPFAAAGRWLAKKWRQRRGPTHG